MKKTSNPRVSYILPCYNVEQYIGKCLETLLNQTEDNIEIICINDASPDNSVSIIKTFCEKDKRVILLSHPQNKGVSHARNYGIREASGDYIGILDPDDWIEPDRTRLLLKYAENGNNTIIGDDIVTDHENSGQSDLQFKQTQAKEITLEEFVLSNIPTLKNKSRYGLIKPLINRQFLLQHNLYYDPNIKFAEDFDLYARILMADGTLQIVPFCGYHYIKRSHTATDISHTERITRVLNVHKKLEHNVNKKQLFKVFAHRKSLIISIAHFHEKLEALGKWRTLFFHPMKSLYVLSITYNWCGAYYLWKKSAK